MTADANPNSAATGSPEPRLKPRAKGATLLKFPGLVAIGLYMLLLAGVVVVFVVQRRVGALFLVFPPLFFAGGLGLMMLLRWAWALTLAAAVLTAGLSLWSFANERNFGYLVQGLVNLVIFLYLVRAEVRVKLR